MVSGLNFWNLLVAIIYLLTITGVGIYAARKVKTVGDFVLGGRKFGKFLTTVRDFGLGTSTDEPVIVVGQSYAIGLAGIWYSLINIVATPFYWLIRPWLRRMRLYTMGDFCEKRFGKKYGYFYSFFGVLKSSVVLGLILKGTSSAVAGISGGVIPVWAMVLVMAVLFILYGAAGGQYAGVITDSFQVFFIIILSFLLVPFCVVKAGGFAAISNALPKAFFQLVGQTGTSEITGFFIIMTSIVTLNAAMGNPNAATVIGKTEWETRIGMVNGMLLKRLCTVAWAFSGVFFAAIYPGIVNHDQVLGTAIVYVFPVGLVGLMTGAMMATAMSCCVGFMVIAGAYFTENFYKKAVIDKNEKHYLFVNRVASVGCAIAGVFFALIFPTLVDLLKYAWVIPSFVGMAIWVSLAWHRTNRYGAWATVVVTATTHAVCSYVFKLPFATTALIYLVTGYTTLITVSLLTPREPEERLDEFYALLHTPIGQEDRLRYAQVEVLHY